MGVKVAVVGAGSTYTPELVEGLVRRTERFAMDELVLLDVDPERLAIVGGLARRMLDAAGYEGSLTLTRDAAEAIDGASFVIVQLRVGGQAARLRDETIPQRFGCVGQETTGPGGFAMALRTVPVVLELAELTAERGAKDAWFVDFTNPTGLVTQALLDEGHRATGLCNVAINLQRRFAARFDVEPARVELDHVGLNHLSWERQVRVDGVDRLPELLETDLAELGKEVELPPELIASLQAVPSYYLRYYYLSRQVLEEQRARRTRAEEVMEIEGRLLEMYRDPALHEKPELLERRGGAYYSEAAAQLVASLADDAGDVQVVNVRNDGAIANLPEEDVVEMLGARRRPWPRPDRHRAARPGDARARAAREGVRAAHDRRRDQRRPDPRAEGAHGEPPGAGPPDGGGAPRRDPRGEPRAPPPVLSAMNAEALVAGVRIDAATKGFPRVDGSVPLGEVAGAGWTLGDLEPPVLAIRRSALEHNLRVMARYCREHEVGLAPHGKTTMAPQLWERQLAAGAWGITAASARQAAVMRAAGVERVVIANEVTDAPSIARLARDVAPGGEVLTYVDSLRAVEQLAGAGSPLDVLVELGHPHGRTGARTFETAAEVARAVAGSETLSLRGVAGYEGTIGHDRSEQTLDAVRAFVGSLADLVERLDAENVLPPRPVVTAGGSLFFDVVTDVLTGRLQGAEVLLRSGCSLTHDHGMYEAASPFSGTASALRPALEAYGAVLSRPEPGLALVGLGKRDVPSDAGLPVPLAVRGGASLEGRAEVMQLNDQHAYIRLDPDVELEPGELVAMGILASVHGVRPVAGAPDARRRGPRRRGDHDVLLARPGPLRGPGAQPFRRATTSISTRRPGASAAPTVERAGCGAEKRSA